MAMYAQRDVIDALNMFVEVTEKLLEFSRHRVTNGIGNVDCRGTGLDGSRDHLGEISKLCARGIFRRKLDVIAQFFGHTNCANRTFYDFFLGHLEFVFTVNSARGDEDMDAMIVSTFNRRMDFFNVLGIAAGKTANCWSTIFIGDCFHRFKIARRCCRETGLDNVHVKIRKGLGDS